MQQQNYQQPADAHQPRPQGQYTVKHNFDGHRKLSTTIVHAVADVVNADVSIVERHLFTEMDRPSFDNLFQHNENVNQRWRSHLGFHVLNFHVTVYSDGHIVITPPT